MNKYRHVQIKEEKEMLGGAKMDLQVLVSFCGMSFDSWAKQAFPAIFFSCFWLSAHIRSVGLTDSQKYRDKPRVDHLCLAV